MKDLDKSHDLTDVLGKALAEYHNDNNLSLGSSALGVVHFAVKALIILSAGLPEDKQDDFITETVRIFAQALDRESNRQRRDH